MSGYRIERLSNGLVRLFDYACKWAVLYRPDGTFHSGGVDSADYRRAVAGWLRAGS